ncbi:MAG: hypothetical protein L0312_16430, partial [Acidobacteria bacterium]|nr:hypothetical protein [Acidobacteriota bacterium]
MEVGDTGGWKPAPPVARTPSLLYRRFPIRRDSAFAAAGLLNKPRLKSVTRASAKVVPQRDDLSYFDVALAGSRAR